MIKAIFFDIDGTLVGFGHSEISDKTVRALDELRSRGVRLIISSGRCKQLITNVRDYPFDGYITMNGAIVEYGGKTISSIPSDRDDAVRIAELSDSHGYACAAIFSDFIGVNMESETYLRINRKIHIKPFPIINLQAMVKEREVYQYTVYASDKDIDRYYRPLVRHVRFPSWDPSFSDVTPDSVSKGLATEAVMRYLGLSREETAAFGDGGNDIPMLDAVGTAVAMGNSSPEVKEHATLIAEDADEDGVAKAMLSLGLV